MTLIRVKATGSGLPTDPVRIDMPTYSIVGIDPVTMLATIDIPDADLPPNMPNAGDPNRPNTPYGPVLTGHTQQALSQWTTALRARYPNKGANWNPPNPQ